MSNYFTKLGAVKTATALLDKLALLHPNLVPECSIASYELRKMVEAEDVKEDTTKWVEAKGLYGLTVSEVLEWIEDCTYNHGMLFKVENGKLYFTTNTQNRTNVRS